MQFSRSPVSWLMVCFTVLGISLSGCVEQSMVIKVKDDGSGVIQLRNHQQEVVIPFGSSKAPDESADKSLPSAETLEQLTKRLGTGVTLVSARESTNRSGWSGYDLVWEFKDINQITLSDGFNELLNDKKENEKAADKSDDDDDDEADKIPTGIRFAMREGLLEIRPFGFDQKAAPENETEQIGTVDPFAADPAASSGTVDIFGSVTEEIAIKFLSEARVGLFVEVDGVIESTNAKHREGNLITLMKFNVGELLENPESRGRIQQMSRQRGKPSTADLQALADGSDGLDLDLQNPLRVKIR